jgi:hypothetical protein
MFAIGFLARRLVRLCAWMFVSRLAGGFLKTRNLRTYRHTDLPTHVLVVRKKRTQTDPATPADKIKYAVDVDVWTTPMHPASPFSSFWECTSGDFHAFECLCAAL